MLPTYLKPGDKVAVIATAKIPEKASIEEGIRVLKSWGLSIEEGKHLYKKFHTFAGNDAERLQDFQNALNAPEIKAIFFARGGYGTQRIIDLIDISPLDKYPKWLIGFSDLTVTHFLLQKNKIPSVHGAMPASFVQAGSENALQTLHDLLFGIDFSYKIPPSAINRPGLGKGELIGGNISLISNNIGTTTDIDFSGKILFLEEVGEYLYHLDRMMVHLKRAGKLTHIAGLIVGAFFDMKDNETEFGKSANEIVLDAVKEFNYPVCFDFPAGHIANNQPLLFGHPATLEVSSTKVFLSYSR